MYFACRLSLWLTLAVSVMAGGLKAEQTSRVPDWVVRDLEKIREQIGGVADGSSFGSDADASQRQGESAIDFGDAYRRVANQPAQLPNPTATCSPQERRASALRDAARLLELAGADLEDMAAYREADELRRRAKKLRLDARRAAAPSSPPSHE